MKSKRLESTLDNIKIIGRASWGIPYIIAICTTAIICEESKRVYYNLFKIPYATFEREDFNSYIRLDKSPNKKV